MPEFRIRFGGRLRQRRAAAGLTQSQLARALPGATEPGKISRWERGEAFPTYANIVALAAALGVTEEVLLHDGPEQQATNGRA